MIIDGKSYDTIESGISNIFNTDVNKLKEIMNSFMHKANQGKYNDMDEFQRQCFSFIKKKQVNYIDKICVYHLGRHIEIPNKLMPLPELLNTQNSMTKFLKNRGIEFTYRAEKIIMFYRGKEIPEKKIYDERRFENHNRLAKRLGYFKRKDFCVNGFAFAADIQRNSNNYFISLYQGPELLQDIDDFLKTNICDEYNKISKYYLFSLEVPLEDIIFDSKEDMKDRKEKEIYYLYECMLYLYTSYENKSGGIDNPMLRFSDDKSIYINGHTELS